MIAKYLYLGIGLITALSLVLFSAGVYAGASTRVGSLQERALLIGGSLLSSLFLVAGVLLRHQIGDAVLIVAVIFDVVLCVAMMGGIGVGRKRKSGGGIWGLNTFLTFLVIALLLGFVRSKGLELAAVAKEVGIENSGSAKDEPKYKQTCEENLKSLYTALKFYVQDWDALPPAKSWMENTDLVSKVTKNSWLHCPSVSNGSDERYGYAYNATLAEKPLKLEGKPLDQMPNAANTPLIYDSSTLDKSAADANVSLPKQGRHTEKNFILYADGSVKAVAP